MVDAKESKSSLEQVSLIKEFKGLADGLGEDNTEWIKLAATPGSKSVYSPEIFADLEHAVRAKQAWFKIFQPFLNEPTKLEFIFRAIVEQRPDKAANVSATSQLESWADNVMRFLRNHLRWLFSADVADLTDESPVIANLSGQVTGFLNEFVNAYARREGSLPADAEVMRGTLPTTEKEREELEKKIAGKPLIGGDDLQDGMEAMNSEWFWPVRETLYTIDNARKHLLAVVYGVQDVERQLKIHYSESEKKGLANFPPLNRGDLSREDINRIAKHIRDSVITPLTDGITRIQDHIAPLWRRILWWLSAILLFNWGGWYFDYSSNPQLYPVIDKLRARADRINDLSTRVSDLKEVITLSGGSDDAISARLIPSGRNQMPSQITSASMAMADHALTGYTSSHPAASLLVSISLPQSQAPSSSSEEKKKESKASESNNNLWDQKDYYIMTTLKTLDYGALDDDFTGFLKLDFARVDDEFKQFLVPEKVSNQQEWIRKRDDVHWLDLAISNYKLYRRTQLSEKRGKEPPLGPG